MSTAPTQAGTPFSAANEFVSTDFSALASHMSACHRAHGPFFRLRVAMETLHTMVSPRIMTTAAVFTACGLGLLTFA